MHAHADADVFVLVRHSVIARVLTFYMDISAYFSCQNFVGARPL